MNKINIISISFVLLIICTASYVKTGNVAGELYNDTDLTVNNTSADVYRTLTGLTTYVQDNCTVNDSIITVNEDGLYLISHHESFTSSVNNTIVHLSIFVNDVENTTIEVERKIGTANDLGASAAIGLKQLSSGDVIKVKYKSDKISTTTVNHSSFSLHKIK